MRLPTRSTGRQGFTGQLPARLRDTSGAAGASEMIPTCFTSCQNPQPGGQANAHQGELVLRYRRVLSVGTPTAGAPGRGHSRGTESGRRAARVVRSNLLSAVRSHPAARKAWTTVSLWTPALLTRTSIRGRSDMIAAPVARTLFSDARSSGTRVMSPARLPSSAHWGCSGMLRDCARQQQLRRPPTPLSG